MLRPRHPQNIRIVHAQGFTTIELMVTVAIMAVLAALAAPSFTPLVERWRVRQATEELQSTLYYARSEAIKRGGNVAIARNAGAGECTSVGTDLTLWSCGWTIFSDNNNNGTLDNGEAALQLSPIPSQIKIQLSENQSYISVDRWGQASTNSSSNFNFVIAPQNSGSPNTAKLCIYTGGRIKRLDTGNDSCT